MIFALKLINLLSLLFPSRSENLQLKNDHQYKEPDLIGEIISIEEHWVCIDGIVYIDIRDAKIIDENYSSLEYNQIIEGDIVSIWITESELVQTTPALGTATVVQRNIVTK